VAESRIIKNKKVHTKGTLFVISAPSGAGKTTLCKRLLKKIPNMKLSVSYTTRKARSGEKNDVHYSFITEKRFKNMIDRGEFAEWATVHGNLYGTALKRLIKLNKEGYDIILDIDIRGALQLKQTCDNAVYIFILPPSMKTLERRLVNRKSDSKDVIARRIHNAKAEIVGYADYDYVVVNDKLDKAYRELESIIISSRLEMENADHAWIKSLVK
jgi:guanylate kinase